MSLSPSYADRVRIFPEQPRPPAHWPQDCAEVMSHEWLRVFRCPLASCGKVHEVAHDDMRDADSLACYGDGVTTIREEP